MRIREAIEEASQEEPLRRIAIASVVALAALAWWLGRDRAVAGGARAREAARLELAQEPMQAGSLALRLSQGVGARAVDRRAGRACTVVASVVEPHGATVAGTEVWLVPAWHPGDICFDPLLKGEARSETSGAGGRARFLGVEEGVWWIGPAPEGSGGRGEVEEGDIAPLGQALEVPPDVAELAVEIRLQRGQAIRGTVLQPDGRPACDGFVQARALERGGSWRDSFEHPDGRFTLGPLAAGGYRLVAGRLGAFADSEPVEARTGDSGVVLRLRPGASLRGHVVDAATRQPVAARVVLSGSSGSGALDPERVELSSAPSTGEFAACGLAPSRLGVAATTADGRAGVLKGIELGEGQELGGLVVEVAPGARLRIRYEGPAPAAHFRALFDGVPVASDGIEKGTETVVVVPSGAVVARITTFFEPADHELELELSPGETRAVVFDGGWK